MIKYRIAKKLTRLFGLALATFGSVVSMQSAPSELHVSGNQILNASNQPVRLIGVNVPSLKWSWVGEYVQDSVIESVDSWHSNIIRLNVDRDKWLTGGTYLTIIDDVVAQASANNIYVLLDLHHDYQPTPGALTFWTQAATRYKNNPTVIFGLYNEPVGITWAVWKDGDANGPGMQDLLDAVRATGAKNMVTASGVSWGYDLSGVLNGYALSDTTGNGIVYEAHLYPWKGLWQAKVGNVAQVHPVILGEFGHPGGTDFPPVAYDFSPPEIWVPKVLAWVDTHNLHWTGYSLHPTSAPVMITDWQFTPSAAWGFATLARLQGYQNPSTLKVTGGTVIGTTGTRLAPTSGVLTDTTYGAVMAFAEPNGQYFDGPTASGAWTGLDLGTAKRIMKIDYMPRQSYGSRMVGGIFQGSNSATFSSGVVNLFTVASAPTDTGGVFTSANVSNTGTYRYVRYLGPANAYCNVDEIRFYTGDGGGLTAGGTDVIVDNTTSSGAVSVGVSRIGTWTTSTSQTGQFEGLNYWHDGNAGKGTKSVRFTPNLATYGSYEVFAKWNSPGRATNVPIDINHAFGINTVTVDQNVNGGQWVSLGVYNFLAGTTGNVLIRTTGTSAFVIADAVRFVRQPEIIVDNADPVGVTITGDWAMSTDSPGYIGNCYLHDRNTQKGALSIRFAPNLPSTGTWEVFMRWSAAATRSSSVPIQIVTAGGTVVPTTVNQTLNNQTWVSIGVYNFTAGSNGSVLISNTGTTGHVMADAVKFVWHP